MADKSLVIRGAWISILTSLWWSDTRGKATKSLSEWSRVLGIAPKMVRRIAKELLDSRVASGEYLDNQNITIISRRMVRDEEIRQIRRTVGKLGGNPALVKTGPKLQANLDNQKPGSSVSVSVSVTGKDKKSIAPTDQKRSDRSRPPSDKEEYFVWFDGEVDVYLKTNREIFLKAYPSVNQETEAAKMKVWMRGNYEKRKSKIGMFVTKWIARAQEGPHPYQPQSQVTQRERLNLWPEPKP